MEEIKVGRDKDNDKRWRKENLRQILFRLNTTKEADVIKHLETIPNRREYFINLIREDMKKGR